MRPNVTEIENYADCIFARCITFSSVKTERRIVHIVVVRAEHPPSKAPAGNHHGADANTFRARLTSLSERDRKILSLYCESVLTLREIGKILHIRENAVGVYKSRAVEKLRRDFFGGRLREKMKGNVVPISNSVAYDELPRQRIARRNPLSSASRTVIA